MASSTNDSTPNTDHNVCTVAGKRIPRGNPSTTGRPQARPPPPPATSSLPTAPQAPPARGAKSMRCSPSCGGKLTTQASRPTVAPFELVGPIRPQPRASVAPPSASTPPVACPHGYHHGLPALPLRYARIRTIPRAQPTPLNLADTPATCELARHRRLPHGPGYPSPVFSP